MTGTIKKIMPKGFGFISVDGQEDGKDMFFHFNNVTLEDPNELREGDRVSFEVSDGRKGPEAVEVTVLDGEGAEMTPVDGTMDDSMPMADEDMDADEDME